MDKVTDVSQGRSRSSRKRSGSMTSQCGLDVASKEIQDASNGRGR
jgi:hypothetical protein